VGGNGDGDGDGVGVGKGRGDGSAGKVVLLKTACNGPRAICGQSESGPKVPVQSAV